MNHHSTPNQMAEKLATTFVGHRSYDPQAYHMLIIAFVPEESHLLLSSSLTIGVDTNMEDTVPPPENPTPDTDAKLEENLGNISDYTRLRGWAF